MLAIACCLIPLSTQAQETAPPTTKPVSKSVTFLNDLWGKRIDLRPKENRGATVYFFIVRDCPISNAYAPEINRIVADYAGKRIAPYLIYVDADVVPSELKQHYRDFDFHCTALNDRKHELVRQFQVARTPETVVVDGRGAILYQGRIDNTYIDFGKMRHQPDQRDLRNVLDTIVAGRVLTPTRTPVIGCPIAD